MAANGSDGSYKKSINLYNPLGMKGNLANAFAELLKALWKEDYTFLSPVTFRVSRPHLFLVVSLTPPARKTSSHLPPISRVPISTIRKSFSRLSLMACMRILIGSSTNLQRWR